MSRLRILLLATLSVSLLLWIGSKGSSRAALGGISMIGGRLVAAAQASATPTPSITLTPDCTLAWQIVDTPYSTTIPMGFGGVAPLAANDVWAVGGDSNQNPMSEHWNGAGWQIIPAPDPGQYAGFNSVAAVAHNDVWAAGINPGANAPLLEHWDGLQWQVVPSPNPNGDSEIHSIAAISADDIWVVGYTVVITNQVGVEQSLTEHWDGQSWNVIPSANVNPPGDLLPNNLFGVAASAGNDIWAVGDYEAANGSIESLTEHWDGTQWSIVPAPFVGGIEDQLWAISALAPNDAWAVGDYRTSNSTALLALHWDGQSWQPTTVDYPGSGSNGLRGVVAFAHNDVWAVGDYYTPDPHNRTLIEHWDGSTWQVVPSPNVSSNVNNVLNGVAGTSSGDIWSVGEILPPIPQGMPGTVAEHYTTPSGCPTLTPTNTPTPSATATIASTPSATNTATATARTTPLNTSTPIITATPPATATPTLTATSTPPNTPTPMPTITATPQPSITPTDCANPFVDINANVFYAAIHQLNCAGVINGTDATHYSPGGTSTRGQFAKMVALGFGLPLLTPTNGQTFTDVPASYFAYLYIESGYHAGILSGYDPASCVAAGAVWPCYLPNVAISRAQLTKLVVGAAGYPLLTPSQPSFSDVPPSNVFYASIETAHAHRVVNGYPDGTFRPNQSIRRDEMAGIVYRAR